MVKKSSTKKSVKTNKKSVKTKTASKEAKVLENLKKVNLDALNQNQKKALDKIRDKMQKKEDAKKSKSKSKETKKDNIKNLKEIKTKIQAQKRVTKTSSKKVLNGAIISTVKNKKPNTKKNIIELFDLKKSFVTGYLETPVLKGLNIEIKQGDLVSILGPSGSGKTTLLNIISGLDKATSGDVFVLGHNLSLLKDSHLTRFRRENVGFIFQQYNLLSNLTAKENAEVGLNLASKKRPGLPIKDIFETIDMLEQLNKYPHQMSGGQQQRVSIARALAKNPRILFGDEPTGALDEVMGRKVLDILIEINKKYNTTIIIVTHNKNISEITNLVLHIRNGVVQEIIKNENPKLPSEINWG